MPTPSAAKRASRAAKLTGSAIRQRLVQIELVTINAPRALQMDIDGDAGTASATVSGGHAPR